MPCSQPKFMFIETLFNEGKEKQQPHCRSWPSGVFRTGAVLAKAGLA